MIHVHRDIVKLTIFAIINTCVGIYIFFSPLELNRIMVEWLNKLHLAHSDHSNLWEPQEVLVDFQLYLCYIYFTSKVFQSKETESNLMISSGSVDFQIVHLYLV